MPMHGGAIDAHADRRLGPARCRRPRGRRPMRWTPRPVAHASAVCADYPNQAAAQRAADTVDADGDGIYCESLPCPCLKPGDAGGANPADADTGAEPPTPTAGCPRPAGVQPISFSKTKYPNIRRHAERAIRKGWPSVLVLNRPGADARRDRLLEDVPTRAGPGPRRVPAGRRARPRRRPHARQRPARLEGRRRLRALEREPQPRLDARDQAAAVLRRDEVPVRLLLGEGHATRRSHPASVATDAGRLERARSRLGRPAGPR